MDFYTQRNDLLHSGKRFCPRTLEQVTYTQLALCALGPAAETRCSLKEVREEKQRRRNPFLSMSEEEFSTHKNFLLLEGMYGDLTRARNPAPKWSELPPLVRLWAKLECLSTHSEFISYRMEELVPLTKAAGRCLPNQGAVNLLRKFRTLQYLYPERMTEDNFLTGIELLQSILITDMSSVDRQVCVDGVIADYSCTSDCFRGI